MLEHFQLYLKSRLQLTDEQAVEATSCLNTKTFKKGQVILSPGDLRSDNYFVNSGLLRSFTIDEKGKEHIIQFAPENWVISDRDSSIFNEPSQLFIDAIEQTEVLIVPKDFFSDIKNIVPQILELNILMLHNSIRFMQKRINMLLGATAEERYLDFIKLYPNLTLRVPQWMIASYLGVTPESLSRVRKDLAHKHFKKD
ncbi:Crp/Fnr family transcriptional regulator [Pedobacter montanisoli]|uniref:Crp/Fnr family transcriptional regulator n=1 Tax=Pedobacter montanisoli TaxID=2923277 RepID=A0ABS9ZTP7_9SPHI|nr:Crp/Fnr family transcriptional regulator [Pedobacter montanisoli]MCJ0741947.1 Crp/Fnr family transcriptional regulator [Pedobacter montanisoli]